MSSPRSSYARLSERATTAVRNRCYQFVYVDSLDVAVFFVCPAAVIAVWQFYPQAASAFTQEMRALLTSDMAKRLESQFHSVLELCGVPAPHPDMIQLACVGFGVLLTVVCYFVGIGRRHLEHRTSIEKQLKEVTAKMLELEERQNQAEKAEMQSETGKKNVRIFMEGAFDLMHYGHMNAFRLGKQLGTHLVVGVNDGETIAECKGSAPVMTDEERCGAVRGCRFVDTVIPRTPYVMTPEYLAKVIREHDIDYVVHGDDPCIVDGEDVYGHVKKVGKYKSIPRTEGVSTTDIVGRMLLCNKAHHQSSDSVCAPASTGGQFASKFMTSAQVLRGFSSGMVAPKQGAKVVYMDGAWDMFHSGHVAMLEQASKLGDFLLVGVFSDATVNSYRGANFPIMNLQERALSVMGCKYVNDVILDSPYIIDEDIIKSQNISVVAHGTVSDDTTGDSNTYKVPRQLGIYREVKSCSDLTTTCIIDRIQANKEKYEKKFADKLKKEQAYYDERYGRTADGGHA